ncbi:MAG: PKD domain-containing protein [Bacteroidia bacterium]
MEFTIKSGIPNYFRSLVALVLFAFISFDLSAQINFIENKGQWPQQVIAKSQMGGSAIWIENQGLTYQFWDYEKIAKFHQRTAKDSIVNFHTVKLNFKGANPRPYIQKNQAQETLHNYYLGSDKTKWASGALAYHQITLVNIYPNIDLQIDADEKGFKYSFIVHAGGNYENIKTEILGADDIFLQEGALNISTTLEGIKEEAPLTYLGDYSNQIASSFELTGNILSYKIGDYNKSSGRDLVIDPSVVFSSLSGSNDIDNWGFTATYDEDGNALTGGTVYGLGYPTSLGAYQRNYAGGTGFLPRDCGIYKLSSDGTKLVYMTYLGGNGNEQPHSLVVNHNDELLIFGTTTSNDFPTRNAIQSTSGGRHDVFISKLNSNGTRLLSSTYLGDDGEDGINGEYFDEGSRSFRNTRELVYNYGDLYRGEIIVDSANNVYVATTTESQRFPVTGSSAQNRYQGGQQDGIVIKLTPNIDTMVWGTFVGGSSHDAVYSLDLDIENNVYVTGGTKSSDFPTSSTAYDDTRGGGMADAFITLIANDGSGFDASTYIGTNDYDQGFFIKVGPDGAPYVLGQTAGSSFPNKNTTNNSNFGLFITKFKRDLSDIQMSKKIGANNIVGLSPAAFTVDQCGRIYFSGWGGLNAGDNTAGNSRGYATTVDAIKRATDGRDFYMAVYTSDLQTIIYATYFGGNDSNSPNTSESSEHVDGGTSRFDKRGVIYQAICGACGNDRARFPTFPSNVYGSSTSHDDDINCNNAVVKIDLEGPALYAEFERTDISCEIPQTITFTNYTQKSTSFKWDMGDGTTYSDSNVTHTFTQPGTYIVTLVAQNPIACNLRDTVKERITIYAKSEADFGSEIDVCTGEVTFNHTGNYAKSFNWDFGDGNSSKKEDPEHQFVDTGSYTVILYTDLNTDCADTFEVELEIVEPEIDFELELDTCNKILTTKNLSKGFESILWRFDDGDTSSKYSPFHVFDQRGQYSVSLTTNLNTECEDSVVIPIEIIDPEAGFTIDIDTCASRIRLENESIDASGFKWSLSDGRKFNTPSPLVDFTQLDQSYTLSLIAAPYSACADTVDTTFRMPGLPKADFAYEADTCVSALQFINQSKDAPNFKWDFGNGESSTSNFPFVNFRDTGEFLVQLIAYPGSQCPDTQEMIVYVDTFRYAEFELDLDTCNFIVQVNNNSEDLDSFWWELGDGSLANGSNPEHTYNEDGEYIVTMYGLKTRSGCRDTFETAFIIPELPEPFAVEKTDSCLNTFIFTDTSRFAEQVIWKASNGDSLIGGNEFRVTFNRVDSHQITLIVKSQYDCWDTLITDVVIDSMPKARNLFALDSCNGALQINDQSYGAFRWLWNLDDGFRSRDSMPFVEYEQMGTKQIIMVINKGTECEDTLIRQVEITEYQTGAISTTNIFTPNGDGYNDIWKVSNLRTDCDEYVLYIYNRWGVLVKEVRNGDAFEWDGNNVNELVLGDGVPVSTGVYFFVLTSPRITRTGNIHIVR